MPFLGIIWYLFFISLRISFVFHFFFKTHFSSFRITSFAVILSVFLKLFHSELMRLIRFYICSSLQHHIFVCKVILNIVVLQLRHCFTFFGGGVSGGFILSLNMAGKCSLPMLTLVYTLQCRIAFLNYLLIFRQSICFFMSPLRFSHGQKKKRQPHKFFSWAFRYFYSSYSFNNQNRHKFLTSHTIICNMFLKSSSHRMVKILGCNLNEPMNMCLSSKNYGYLFIICYFFFATK